MVNLGGTQKVDFLGTCFGGEGLGLNCWAMISFMGRRAPHHGVHARDDIRWSIWEKIPRSTHARLAQQLPSVAFCLAGVPFGDCVARARDTARHASGQRPSSHRGTTRFHTLPSPPPRPTALQTFRHARAPPACTWLRSLPSLAREPRHHLPKLPFALLRPRTNTPHGADTGA